MNVGQALGELQLEITSIKERKKIASMPESEAIAELRARLDGAEADAIKFGVQLSEAKRRAHLAEQKLAGTYDRLAKYERRDAKTEAGQGDIVATVKAEYALKLSQAQEQAADYKRHIERMEADARGDGMQIAELRRKLDQATMLAGKRQQEIDELLKQPAKVVEVPSECPTCAPIIRAIAQAVQASNEPQAMPFPGLQLGERVPGMSAPSVVHRLSDSLPVDPEPEHHPNHMSPQAARGIANGIRAALAAAKAPMPVREIAQVIGIDSKRVATNIPHLVSKGDVTRMVVPSQGAGWCYWLKAKPLPQEVKQC